MSALFCSGSRVQGREASSRRGREASVKWRYGISIYKEENHHVFLLLIGAEIILSKHTIKFASLGDLTKHFKRKHLAHI